MTFPARHDGRRPPAAQHATPWDGGVPTQLQLHLHRAVRLLAGIGGCGAGLCLIIAMVALVAVDTGPGRPTHVTAAAEQRPTGLRASGRASAGGQPAPPAGGPSVLASFTGTGNQIRLPLSGAQGGSWELDWWYQCPGRPSGQLVIADSAAAVGGALVDQTGSWGQGSTWAGPTGTPHYLVVISSCRWAITVVGRP